MKINFQINFRKISKICFRRKYLDYIFILLFVGLMGFACFIVCKYVGIIFQPPPEEKILEIQARQTRINSVTLEEVLNKIEMRESNLEERLGKKFSNPFLPYQ